MSFWQSPAQPVDRHGAAGLGVAGDVERGRGIDRDSSHTSRGQHDLVRVRGAFYLNVRVAVVVADLVVVLEGQVGGAS